MGYPKISVLITVFNHENYLKSSIESILSQDYKNFEIVVVDDGSTDSSKKIINKFKDKRIKKIFFKKNKGRTKCLNYGLKKCNGQYIAIQDADDISKKTRLKKQYAFFENNSNCALLGSSYCLIDKKNKIIETRIMKNSFNLKNKLFFNNLIAHSTVMFRKSIISKVGNYPEKYIYAQDYAFYLKVLTKYKIFLLTDNLLNLRVNHDSMTSRLNKTFLIQKEEFNCLIYVIKNFQLNLIDIIRVLFKFNKIFLKVVIIFIKKLF